MNFNKIIKLSYQLAPIYNYNHRCKHFSFILYKNKIVSIGINNPKKTHPKNLRNKYRGRDNQDISSFVGTHSELSAVLKYGSEDCSSHILINTRINGYNRLAYSKPCEGCQNLIKQLNFKKIYYTNNNGSFDSY